MCASGKPKETAMSHGKGKRKCSGTARGSSLVMTLIRQVWFLLSFILYITYDYLIICYTHLNHHVSLCFYSFLFKLRINFWWMQPPVGKKAWANLMSCNDSGLVSLKSIHTHTHTPILLPFILITVVKKKRRKITSKKSRGFLILKWWLLTRK